MTFAADSPGSYWQSKPREVHDEHKGRLPSHLWHHSPEAIVSPPHRLQRETLKGTADWEGLLTNESYCIAYLDFRRRQAVHARAIRRRLAAEVDAAWSDPLSIDGAILLVLDSAEVVRMTGRRWEMMEGELE